MTGQVRAAVFDLDNTLVRGSVLFHFALDLARRRRIPMRHVLRYAVAESVYVTRRTEAAGISGSVAGRALGVVGGMSQEVLTGAVDDFVVRRLHRHLVHEVVGLVRTFRRLGFETFIATASPQEIAGSVAASLGMTGAVGTRSETADGAYTGRLDGPVAHGFVKAQRVQEVFAERGIDARASWAFSDSVSDLPLLMLVGIPVATNADRELAVIARTNGWRTLDRRGPHRLDVGGQLANYPFGW